MSTVTRLQAAPRSVARVPRGRPARRRDGAAVGAVLGRRRSPRRASPATAPARSACPTPSPAWAPRTATRAGCRSGTSTPSPPASRCAPAGIRCPTAPSTTTTSARSSSRCSTRRACRRPIVNWAGDEPVSVQQYSAFFAELLGVEAEVVVEEIPGASLGSVGDHTKRTSITGPCTVGWRDGIPSRGGALLSRPGRGAPMSRASVTRTVTRAPTRCWTRRCATTGLDRLRPGRLPRRTRRAARQPRARRRPEPGEPTPASSTTSVGAW